MNLLAIILLAFTVVGPLSARAMLDSETTVGPPECVWEECGTDQCTGGKVVVRTRTCTLAPGDEGTESCCSVRDEKAL
ncbi:hypothetical protein F4604DRAFT_1717913 [Suillus subluteus]|nr:hypothetical protein F4604DRAFT_1717913 [Suillus subluteus]